MVAGHDGMHQSAAEPSDLYEGNDLMVLLNDDIVGALTTKTSRYLRPGIKRGLLPPSAI
jgi:hypothetical protein